jgi:hypothetical protein
MPVSLPTVLISFSFLIDLKEMPIDEYKQTVVAAYFLSKRFYILDTCVIFHEIMFFKELSAFIALYFIQGTLFPSGRFISFMALLFLGKELLFKVFLSAGKRFIIALSLIIVFYSICLSASKCLFCLFF